MPSQSPYHALSRYFSFPNRDHQAWWTGKGPLLGNMLADAGYPEQQQYQYLTLFNLHLIPALGPSESHGAGIDGAEWKSLLSGSGKLEFSMTYRKSAVSLRIAFEPTSLLAGTKKDVFNKRRTQQLLGDLERLDIDIDTVLYHPLFDTLVVSDEEEAALQNAGTVIPDSSRTQQLLALNLIEGNVRADLYVYPYVKALATGTASSTLLWAAVKKIDRYNRFRDALSILKGYFETYPSSTTNPMFLSSDLAAPRNAFCRLFFSETNFSWERVQHLWTLGGTLSDKPTLKGLELAKILWDILGISTAPASPDSFPLLFTFELRPEQPYLRQKLGIPVSGLTESAIANACVAFFERLGWDDHAASYRTNLSAY
uniref:Prenyltransferase malB n=1 Tax=Malbranchea aurantiaca TaxID=78605 RepID=MALB_MALAU|nr:RecName: Full=Prenyltransferase malB; AltName: Full=Malbrancheamide biosynthesis cluster protein B [Malbranchea aurantiaca]AGA37262.1 prenyltransferase [Malbranchea aurantiaca]